MEMLEYKFKRMALNDQIYTENEFDDTEVENIPRDVFTTLADLLTYDCEKYAQSLLIDDSSIKKVKDKFHSTREQTFQILNRWRKNNPLKKWRDMKNGLITCERKDLVRKCEKLMSRHTTFGVLPPIRTFFSRDDELLQIHKCVFERIETGKLFTVLTGMSGIGKTQLARMYAKIYNKCFQRVVWLDAAVGKIQTSIINLCHVLGISVNDSQGNAFDVEVIVTKAHNYFEREKTLFIFDNVDDESVKNFEKFVSTKPNAFTLVTSQWKTWSDNVYQVQINPFSQQVALLFMKERVKTNDEEKLKEITEALRYHPLAINQAILYISNNNISLEKYLDLFRSYPVEMLEETLATEAETKSAITTINLVLNKIETPNEKSVQILNHLSYCDGQNITKQFIRDILKYLKLNDEHSINCTISLLISYSLLDSFDGNKDRYVMHEITQVACKSYQKRKKITETCIKNIIEILYLELKKVTEHIDYGKQFYKHFLHMFRICKPKMCEAFHQQSDNILSLLTSKGFFQEAIHILDAIQNYNTISYGSENEITLASKDSMGFCLYEMGKYNEALEIHYQIDKIQTNILPKNHILTQQTCQR